MSNKISFDIGFHLDYYPRLPKRIHVTISDDVNAKKFELNKRWKLIVISDYKRPYVLGKNAKLNNFQNNKIERLYFHPEICLRS